MIERPWNLKEKIGGTISKVKRGRERITNYAKEVLEIGIDVGFNASMGIMAGTGLGMIWETAKDLEIAKFSPETGNLPNKNAILGGVILGVLMGGLELYTQLTNPLAKDGRILRKYSTKLINVAFEAQRLRILPT